jgi:hypothetical protein
MTAVFRSRLIGLALAAAVGWLPIAPPEHVHEADDHGHQRMVVHRHLAPHTLPRHADHQGRVFDDDDAPVLTLNVVYTVPTATSIIGRPPSVESAIVAAPLSGARYRSPEYFDPPIHGPPRAPSGLRAPPLISRL